MSDIDALNLKACELFGFEFQEAYTLSLRLVVTRRRQGCNDTQAVFWMCAADEAQKREAHNDAMAIIQLGLQEGAPSDE